METRITGVAAAPAPRVSAPSAPAAAKPQPAADAPKPEPVTDKVTLSTKGGGVVENHGVAANGKDNAAKGDNNPAVKDAAKKIQPREISTNYAQFNTNLTRSYSLEANERVVVKVMQKADKKVVKEIPSRQERHVKDVIVRYIENDGNLLRRDVNST